MNDNRKNFLDLVIYQIYIRSFKDSNGDGIGDIRGVIEKLDYLDRLGVNALWLSPCYKSPNFDNGYDISDYRDIMDEFGTFDDMKELIKEAHSRGIKIFLDLVVNHTSSEHKWFKEARSSRDNIYHDYYIWADKPLNKWNSQFGGSAWEYNSQTDEYYLHSFAVQQPDLNWENPKLRQECCDIVDFWVDLGVDGFRCDVLDFISKDFNSDIMYNGPKVHEYIKLIFGRKKVKDIFTVGECQSDEKNIIALCGEDRHELVSAFNFEHLNYGREGRWVKLPFSYDHIRNVLVKWQKFSIKNDLLYMLFTDNHDNPFYVSRLGNDNEFRYECATMYAAMFYLLKGIPLIYQGQEFGSVSSKMDSLDDFDDIETVNYIKTVKSEKDRSELLKEVNFGTRDNTRHPIAWNSDKNNNFGFSSGKPWLKPCSRAEEINLEKDRSSQKSVFNFYKKILDYRLNNACIKYGDFTDLTVKDGYFAYRREYNGEEVVVICNFDKENDIVLTPLFDDYKIEICNYSDRKSLEKTFRPFETVVLKKTD